MADKILAKDKLGAFVEKLGQGRDVFAPAREGDKLVWAPVRAGEDLLLDFSNTDMSPKDFFFPQTECMMRFANDPADPAGMVMQAEPLLNTPRALMNIRPCDAKAFQVLDLIFVQDQMTNDQYWRDKREKTVLVGLACNDPCPTCFCTTVGSNPHGETGLDLLLVDLGDKFLVKVLSDQGAELVGDLPDAADADESKAAELKAAAEAGISGGVAMDQVNAREVMALYELPMWDRVQENCLNCGTCTGGCPATGTERLNDLDIRKVYRMLAYGIPPVVAGAAVAAEQKAAVRAALMAMAGDPRPPGPAHPGRPDD